MPNQTKTLKPSRPARENTLEYRTDKKSRKFYQTSTWRKFRNRVVKKLRKLDELRVHDLYEEMPRTSFSSLVNWLKGKDPLCRDCLEEGYIRAGNVADHEERIRSGGKALDEKNITPRCQHHHNIKSGKEAHE